MDGRKAAHGRLQETEEIQVIEKIESYGFECEAGPLANCLK
jgi:hypothetical protein